MNQQAIQLALDHLVQIDDDVAQALDIVGYPSPRIRTAGFETFLNTLVSQQISTHAADAIWCRVCNLMPTINAQSLLSLPKGALRMAGLSERKVRYAQSLASDIVAGKFDPDSLDTMDDASAIKAISQLHGFGRWSAEIYLMFSLQRPDILPADDLIILTALQKLKRLEAKPTPMVARELVKHWSPWRSAGSLLLWRYHRLVKD